MSVYARFKKDKSGFRHLVELLEITPKARREKMIKVGMEEDADYTEKAIAYMLNFEDVLELPDMELTEVLATVPPRVSGMALSRQPTDVKRRFMQMCPPERLGEFRDQLEMEVTVSEIGGAQLKMIEHTRKLERMGYVRTKQLPAA